MAQQHLPEEWRDVGCFFREVLLNDIPHINFGYEVRRPSCDE